MNIGRHNYEEFFILYWDNELTADQKKLIESFVQENPDLQDEFRLFGETRFTPDPALLFEEKELLFCEENSFINITNYPAWLLSYMDDELTPDQKKMVEQFAAKHPAVQQELNLFQQTKLQPDTDIIFPDKSILYRREEKARIIRMTWMRVAVAAAILLMAGLITFTLINNNDKSGQAGLATTNTPEKKQEVQRKAAEKITVLDQKSAEQILAENKKAKIVLPKPAISENPIASVTSDNKLSDNKNNLPKEKRTVETPLIAENTAPTQADELLYPELKKKSNDALAVADTEKKNNLFDNPTVTERPTPAYTVYNPTADEKTNEDKGGLKGFLRKATRVFEHRTKIQTTTDDNKLLVGVFAVSLK